MLSAQKVVRLEKLAGYAKRHATITAKENQDIWFAFLATKGSGTMREQENKWLDSLGATGKTLHDKWMSYLTAQGYTGKIDDMMNAFFNT